MDSNRRQDPGARRPGLPAIPLALGGILAAGVVGLVMVLSLYNSCRIEVGKGQQAVLIRKVGLDLASDMEIAPEPKDGAYYKGVQPGFLTEGRYFYNPFYWSWEIRDQKEVPDGQLGVKIALVGDDLPLGQVLARPGQKGILDQEPLRPGRYPYNWYAEDIELHELVSVPAGFQGVVTLLAGRPPKDPNQVLVGAGERGVQRETLAPGTYLINPYRERVSLVDCRSKRFNLDQDYAMDFLSADGFPVSLSGAVEFRVKPERAAEVFVLYNTDENGDAIDEEIIAKIITPESRSICRIGGSRLTGGQFIKGADREIFQQNLVKTLEANCAKQGVEILAVAITSIHPPEAIAGPVRDREVAKQTLAQFEQEKLQQVSEAQLRVEELLADQKKEQVEAEQGVVERTTKAEQEQSVAVTKAEQELAVAEKGLEAVKSKASAVIAEAEADAQVIRYKNTAELAGLATRVAAFEGDGQALAENVLVSKLAPAFRSILSNSDGPLMELFGQFSRRESAPTRPATPLTSTSASPAPTVANTPTSHEDLPGNPFTSGEEAKP